METLILSGRETSKSIRNKLKEEISELPWTPQLAVILVGNDPASAVYVRNKEKGCAAVGIRAKDVKLSENITPEELRKIIVELDSDPDVDGILLQLPLPEHLDEKDFLPLISYKKDVDGFHPVNQGKLFMGENSLFSCTPNGIIQILKHYNIRMSGKHAVVVGRSNIVGKPMAGLLLREDATVTVCHSKTTDLEKHVRRADILVVAAGKRNLINPIWIQLDTVVIDVGMHRLENGKVGGDLDTEALIGRVAALTPVPGGVGPMTITMLLHNTVKASIENRR
ncbi:MAG: bifunctional methylenetetrahydrofolate dehydrogenase/methenyltetrahydrofolate cyclohydrolase FolD [Deltaproteobacteria bacterium]|nr:bifunctional methylenetetrahydrofolate dehydrogenase/methenyltetrahydrofolate cyclohydrolase FolD [Deltaproteobacteria bacterium]